MKDSVDDVVMASVELPANWDNYRVEVLWDELLRRRWGLTPYRLILGANAASADTKRPLVVTAGAQNTLVSANTFWTGSAAQSIDKTAIAHVFAVTRRRSAAQDTLTGVARFYGIRVINFEASGPSLM